MGKIFLIFSIIASIAYLYVSTSYSQMAKAPRKVKHTAVKSSEPVVVEKIEKVAEVQEETPDIQEPAKETKDVSTLADIATDEVNKTEIKVVIQSEDDISKVENIEANEITEASKLTEKEELPIEVQTTEPKNQKTLTGIAAKVRAFAQEFKDAGIAH